MFYKTIASAAIAALLMTGTISQVSPAPGQGAQSHQRIASVTMRTRSEAAEPALLTAEEAQSIALNHAGFAADQVRFLRTEPELRDRVPHYDVEFAEGRWEYEYEIHAETGAVLSFEKDD